MKRSKHVFFTALMLTVLSAGAWAEDSESGKPAANEAATAPAPPTITAADVQALKDALAAQQLQINRLTEQLERHQSARNLSTTGTPTPEMELAAVRNSQPVQQDSTSSGLNLQDAGSSQGKPNPMESPTVSIHFKGITITPGGFVASEFVRRSRALGSDVPTSFNTLTMPGASQNNLSEFFGSGRQSRPTVYMNGRINNVEFASYVSADFLSAAGTSTPTQTNSYTLRLRQAWGQAKFDNGWSFLGGQMWSLVTEGKASIAPSDDTARTNDARPSTIDPAYNVGFSFARQYGLRVTRTFGDRVAFAVAIENAQGTLSTHGNTDNFLLGSIGASNSYNNTVTGCTTSSYTPTGATSPTFYTTCSPAGTYTFNPSPDIIAKAAFDPGFGHYEVFGLFDRFRDRVFPCANFAIGTTGTCPSGMGTGPSAAGAYNVSKNGGGIGANARWNFYNKHIVFGLHGFGGSGIGRYGAAQLADMSVHADGSPDLIKSLQGLTTLEWKGKKLDVYAYTGAEFAGRTADYDAATKTVVGYGSPLFNNSGCYTESAPSFGVTNGFNPGSLSKCTADTRVAIEGTVGFWYRFYSGPRGRFQFGTQYSYVTRQTWSGIGPSGAGEPGVTPEGLDSMIFTSFRYYLP